ncbi:MAG: response regulator [Anaerolineae bacterium]|nr:response regulator [Anaerolineae bacterium]
MSARILYIEDNRQNMRLVRKMLASKGYEVLEASEGMLGIEVALAELPDLIFVDINLPDIDGMEVTARLKSEHSTQNIPIIALTANAMYGDRERFLEAGCDGYLAKPISKSELINAVEEFLPAP